MIINFTNKHKVRRDKEINNKISKCSIKKFYESTPPEKTYFCNDMRKNKTIEHTFFSEVKKGTNDA